MEKNKLPEKKFCQRLDFYWQYTTVYLIILIVYSVLMGSINEGTITMDFHNPVVILLFVFMLGTSLNLLFNWFKKKTITIGDDYIIFRTRFKERKYLRTDISRIAIGKKVRYKGTAFSLQMIKIKVKDRKYFIRIRPHGYWEEKDMIRYIAHLK
jgi:hypothetical protein